VFRENKTNDNTELQSLMREAAFIKANRDKWQEIDNQTQNKDQSADSLADNFIELTDDLSYARTFYPKSQTVRYLNQLAGRYFLNIYRYRKREKGRFARFWKTELPLIMYRYRKYMLFSFLFFIASVLIGVFSQWQDPDFANLILSPSYVNMTIENIEKGDPMAVYKQTDEAPMLFFISTNNIKVDFLTFIFGIFGCVGTLFIILQNGIMVGVFQYFFIERGLLFESATTIWLHGTLEMSGMIIAGGAGLILGSSLLFPGSYRRIDSLMKGGLDALKIIIGLLPVTMVAAIIESYLTRYTDMPDAVNLTIIGLSGLFIIWYFFYYPFRVHKKLKKINGEN
jgi:uncharacterized membrane protein SpoIIM required for sporulation